MASLYFRPLEGNPNRFFSEVPVMRSFDDFFVVSKNKLLNKLSLWRSNDISLCGCSSIALPHSPLKSSCTVLNSSTDKTKSWILDWPAGGYIPQAVVFALAYVRRYVTCQCLSNFHMFKTSKRPAPCFAHIRDGPAPSVVDIKYNYQFSRRRV